MDSRRSAGPGRYCDLHGVKEISNLRAGMDFRRPEVRREVFLRFYEFHLKYRSHPGAVYYVIPFLRQSYGWDQEQTYWWAFLNGVCQHPVTSTLIWEQFPRLNELNADELSGFFRANYARLGWDTDRRYVKNKFETTIAAYRKELAGRTQAEYFEESTAGRTPREAFRHLWPRVMGWENFGRLSAFSYTEYLRICGLSIDCDSLFMDDLNGSKSHRNGLCKVLGRDDLDWHDSNPGFAGYSPEVISWLSTEGEILLEEARARMAGKIGAEDVSYFTLESTLCCYKSWHRPNRRYPNVYQDMFHDRLKWTMVRWPDRMDTMNRFWAARDQLPPRLRLECNPDDVGVAAEKQNWYRLTGECVLMDLDWPCFANGYSKRLAA